MNKRGFTLIELLAVVVLLAVIAIITSPVIINIVSDSSNKVSNEQKRLIESAAKRYVTDNFDTITDNCICLETSTLRSSGYLKSDDTTTGYVKIVYDTTHKQYTYTYNNTCSCP